MSPESLELNKKLSELTHKEDFTIPYHTFGWRNIDFDKEIPLGVEPYKFEDQQLCKQLIGFLGKPKYGYPRWRATVEQSSEIKRLCQELVKEPIVDNCNKLTEYLQTCTKTESPLDKNTPG